MKLNSFDEVKRLTQEMVAIPSIPHMHMLKAQKEIQIRL